MTRPDPLIDRYGQDLGLSARLSSHLSAHPSSQLPAAMPNAVIERMLAHRSVRAFLDAPLPAGTLDLLVAAAQSAATSSNLQAWSVIAVEDPARRARLAKLANDQAHVARVPLFLVWLADLSRLDRVARRRDEEPGANRFFEMFLVAAIDAALAAQNAALAAESLGLGTVYIGAMRNHPEQVAEELQLPPRTFALFGLCVGHPDPARPADVKPRLAPSVVLHRERYDPAAAREVEAGGRFAAAVQRLHRAPEKTEEPRARQASARVRGAESISGRHGLIASVRRQGFELD